MMLRVQVHNQFEGQYMRLRHNNEESDCSMGLIGEVTPWAPLAPCSARSGQQSSVSGHCIALPGASPSSSSLRLSAELQLEGGAVDMEVGAGTCAIGGKNLSQRKGLVTHTLGLEEEFGFSVPYLLGS
jgi:hypothetical protein